MKQDFANRFDNIAAEQADQRTALEQMLEGDYGDDYDQQYPEQMYGMPREQYAPYPQFPQPQSTDELRQQMQAVVREELAPLREHQHEQLWDAFLDEYDLNDPEALEPYAQAIDQLAEQAGNPDLAEDPRFARQVYEMMNPGQPEGEEGEEGDLEGGEFETEGGNNLMTRLWEEQQNTPARQFMEQLRPEIQGEVQQALAPFQQTQREMAFKDLLEEFPYIATEEGSQVVAQHVQYAADQLGNPELGKDPRFVRMTWLAMNGESRAAPEGGAGSGQGAAVEGDGGSPGEPEPDHPFVQMAMKRQQRVLEWPS